MLNRNITVALHGRPGVSNHPYSPLFIQPLPQTYIQEYIKALRYWQYVRWNQRWSVLFSHNAPVARKLLASHDGIMNEERRKGNIRRSWAYRLFLFETDNLIKSGWISIHDNHHMPWFCWSRTNVYFMSKQFRDKLWISFMAWMMRDIWYRLSCIGGRPSLSISIRVTPLKMGNGWSGSSEETLNDTKTNHINHKQHWYHQNR